MRRWGKGIRNSRIDIRESEALYSLHAGDLIANRRCMAGGFCLPYVKFFLPQVAEINSPQPMDVMDVSLLYDLNGP